MAISKTQPMRPALIDLVDAIDTKADRIRIGMTNVLDVPANESLTENVIFDNAFDADSMTYVLPMVKPYSQDQNVTVKVDNSSSVGFTFMLRNLTEELISVYICYLALATN